jgi:hypothetical protein
MRGTRVMADSEPLLSAIVVVGRCRTRAQRVLDAVGAQTRAESIEVVVVDLESEHAPPLNAPPGTRTVYVPLSRSAGIGGARAEGARRASAPVVAFLEEHCYPSRGWAEALIEAHQGPCVAVGYAFTNANPDTYVARASMTLDYGLWAHPASGGESTLLPYNNCSYKRDALLALGGRLESSLTPDFNVHRHFVERGLPMLVEPRALAAHENYAQLSALMKAHYHYCRQLAARRVEEQAWSVRRRILYSLGTPLAGPLVAFGRLFSSLRGRAGVWRSAVAALPVLPAVTLCAAIGEAVGYTFGTGSSDTAVEHWELDAERSPVA